MKRLHFLFDETIYLTASQALKRGSVLYRDIYDLKPPLIYFTYFLYQSHLFWVRVLATFFTILTATTLFFFKRSLWPAVIFGLFISTTIFDFLALVIALMAISKRREFFMTKTLSQAVARPFWRRL